MNVMISLPENVKSIIHTLNDHGYNAYAVGGCVRDSLLHRIPDDWDITTQALPPQVKALFPRTVDTGIAHGTVTVLMGDEGYEVTTFRSDGVYLDGRHPEEVFFVPNLKEDLLRRDFTINAMAYHEKTGIIDLYGGLTDLEHCCIRCVGDPMARFMEDALRMLRAIRFSAQLNFHIDSSTEEAIRCLCDNISLVSRERIQVELIKLLVSDHPEKIQAAETLGITDVILPDYGKADNLGLLMQVRNDKILRLAGYLYHLSEHTAHTVLKGLKFDNATVHCVSKLVGMKEIPISPDPVSLRFQIAKYGNLLPLHFEMLEACCACGYSGMDFPSPEELSETRKQYRQILQNGDCTSIRQLAINGKDLLALGVPRGEKIGNLLDMVLDYVISYPEKNERELLIAYLKEKI